MQRNGKTEKAAKAFNWTVWDDSVGENRFYRDPNLIFIPTME